MCLNQTLKDDEIVINIAQNEILFECHYPRNIEVASRQFEVSSETGSQPAIGIGKLDYKMVIQAGNLGQQTNVQISPNHGFSQISARLSII